MVDADSIHSVGNPDEVLQEAVGHFLIDRVVVGENESDLQHVLAVKRHPRSAVGLFETSAGGELRAAIEDTDVVEAKKSAGENVAALGILAVHPPVEIQQQALKG